MKYVSIFILAFFLACNERKTEPVKIEINDSTTEAKSPATKLAQKIGDINEPIFFSNKDTGYLVTKDTSVSKSQTVTVTTTYPITRLVIKPYKQPGVVIPPPPTVGTVNYLTLPNAISQTYNGRTNLVIESLQFSGPGNIITLNNCSNITIRKCYFKSGDIGISIMGGANITIDSCLFAANGTSVRAENSTGNVKVINSQFVNGKFKFQISRAQHIQFANIGGTGNLIENCKGENFKGESGAEDLISLFGSKNVLVKNNIFRGGGRFGIAEESSGGIMLGDQGGENLTAEGNKVINVGHYGLCISGGTSNKLINNMAYADANNAAILPSIAYAVYNAGGTTCSGALSTGNKSNWSITAALPLQKNNFWSSGQCANSSLSQPGSLTLAEMAIPQHLINFVTPAELLKIRTL